MIKQVAVGGFDNNFSYFLGDNDGNVAVVDPSNVPLLKKLAEENGLSIKMVLLTHSHFDHTDGVHEIVEEYGVPIYMHENAEGRVETAGEMSVYINEGEAIKVGKLTIEALYTPGHIDDAICYYINKEHSWDDIPRLITGDTVFVGACGRADLPGSNVEDLYNTIGRIKGLPDETEIYPGHDYGSKPVSTIGWEKKHNGYFACKTLEDFKKMRIG